ncbi:MAG: hypothetical protein ACXITV_04885 [Luteibaculaceae bacterium]
MDFLKDTELINKFKKYTKELYYSPNNKSFELTKTESKDYKLFLKLLTENLSVCSEAYKVVSAVNRNLKYKNLARFNPEPPEFDFTAVWDGLKTEQINSPAYLETNPPTELNSEIEQYLAAKVYFERPFQFNILKDEQKPRFYELFENTVKENLTKNYSTIYSDIEKNEFIKKHNLSKTDFDIFNSFQSYRNNLYFIFNFFQVHEPQQNIKLFGESFTNWYLKTHYKPIEPPKTEIQQSAKVEPEPSLKGFKLTAKHFVITYILDCLANSRKKIDGHKKQIEALAKKRPQYDLNPNTFYKNYNNCRSLKFETEIELENEIGENWETIVLQLSEDPNTLKKYLQNKGLIK